MCNTQKDRRCEVWAVISFIVGAVAAYFTFK